jgi:thioredoxin-dependent peroxiredoxin
MRLKKGDKAPLFTSRDIAGQDIGLGKLGGKKVLLSFYRYASCPLCNLRVNQLIRLYPELSAKDLQVIAIFQSPLESILQYVGKQDAPFPIIPDPQQDLYRTYRVETSWAGFAKAGLQVSKLLASTKLGFLPGRVEGDMNRVPADFLIDEEGIIHTAFYGIDISDHLPEEDIIRFVNNQS